LDQLLPALLIGAGEAALLAAAGFFLLGLNEFVIDFIWMAAKVKAWFERGEDVRADATGLLDQPVPSEPRLAVFVPAWQEGDVIGAMLRHTFDTFLYGNYRIYVGCYPNDPETIAAVSAVNDARLRLVVGPRPGGTTKADCLNTLWQAMQRDEAGEEERFAAVVLHDAEDVVHRDALALIGRLIGEYDMVQLPVLPLIDPASRWIGGHYADEFAEGHGKDMAVRQWIGAALPSSGVGCAFSRAALGRIAAGREEGPFDALSLTEDYELGLRIGKEGRAVFVRARDSEGLLIGTREFFPGTFKAAVNQKARWIAGIALCGWDRLGWSGNLAERWMRLRDRQSLLLAGVTLLGYSAFILWLCLLALGFSPRTFSGTGTLLLLGGLNIGLFCWRILIRFGFTASTYGWRQGLLSMPRMLISNVMVVCASARAARLYIEMRRSGQPRWHKTAHAFPVELARG
jgi:adsorption protein B